MTTANTTVVLNSIKGFEVLKSMSGLECKKHAIYACSTVPTPSELSGYNPVDRNSFTLEAGFHFSIGGKGETQPLKRKKGDKLISTFTTLYNADKPLTYEEAKALGNECGVTVASLDNVKASLQMFRECNTATEVPEFPISWFTSKGHCVAFRLPASVGKFYLPKPTWGETAIEEADGCDVIIVNLLTAEIYKIGKEQFVGVNEQQVGEWYAVNSPKTRLESFYNLIPVLTEEQMAEFQVEFDGDPKAAAQKLLTEQRAS
jgi:hypothetical protein